MKELYYYNIEYSDQEIGYLASPPANLPRKGIVIRLLVLAKEFFISIQNLRFSFFTVKLERVVLFANNQNEYNSFKPLLGLEEEKSDLMVWGFDDQAKKFSLFPNFLISLLSIFCVPYVFLCYLIEKNSGLKETYKYCFEVYCKVNPTRFIVYLNLLLYRKKIKKIIFTNDLNYKVRIIKNISRSFGIETVFLPHAQEAVVFPVLTNYDTYLFPGAHFYNIHFNKGLKGANIFLLGTPKFDQLSFYTSKNKREKLTIGICPNTADDMEKYNGLITHLATHLQEAIFLLRPHPADRNYRNWLSIANQYQIKVSDLLAEPVGEFLKNIDVLIAGESNIHFEANYLGIRCFYFVNNSFLYKRDSYNIIKNKLAVEFEKPEDFVQYISGSDYLSSQKDESGIKYYYDNFNSKFRYDSTLLCRKIISEDESSLFTSLVDANHNKVHTIGEKQASD